jgi:hypothetical protein
MVAANPPLILNNNNNTSTNDTQLTSNYNPMAYSSYGSNTSSNINPSSSATAPSVNVPSLYSYDLPAQSDENARYWNTNKRQDNTKR